MDAGGREIQSTSSQPSKVVLIFHHYSHCMKYKWRSSDSYPGWCCCLMLLIHSLSRSSLSLNHVLCSVWLGMINIPAVALGMFSGGVVMKKYKLDIMGAAKFAFMTSLLGYFLSLFFFAMGCENSKVAGITVTYTGYIMSAYISISLLCGVVKKQRETHLIFTGFTFPRLPFLLPLFVLI